MPDVTLVLRANASDHIAKMKQAQTETQKVYDIADKGGKREKGILEEIDATLSRLEKSKRKAFTYEDIEKYNKKIQETKQNLEEYEKAGEKVEKQGESMIQSIGKWVIGLGLAAKGLDMLKEAFLRTQQGMILFNQAGAAMRQVFDNLASGQINLTHGIIEAMALAKLMTELKIKEKRESIEQNKLLREYSELYDEGNDVMKSAADRLELLTKAKEKYSAATKKEIEETKKELAIIVEQWSLAPQNTDLEGKAIDLANKINQLYADLAGGTQRLTKQISTLQSQLFTDIFSTIKKFNEDAQKEIDDRNKEVLDKQLKQEEEYKKAAQKLIDDYDKSNIESLTGVAKLKAIRDFGFKQLKEFRIQLASFGTITKEQDAMFVKLGENVQQAFIEGMMKEARVTPEQKAAISKALLAGIPTPNELQKSYKGGIKTTPDKEFSLWSLIGIDPASDDGKKAIEYFQKASEEIIKIIDATNQKRVEDTRRQRELLDTQVSEAQSALDTEVNLYKAGYASNVGAKKKELADLKIQRDLALKKEEEALKKQRQFDAVEQASSLLVASANLLKGWSKIPFIGQVLAVAAIAAMFASFAAARVQANQAAKFAKGGWTGDGKYRDETGERVAGVVHENEFVVKRGQAGRYRPLLEAINRDDKRMIFNSFNKLRPELLGGTTNVFVENEGPNNRLDQLITENKKLNAKLSGESIQHFGNVQVIRKGNSVRTIR